MINLNKIKQNVIDLNSQKQNFSLGMYFAGIFGTDDTKIVRISNFSNDLATQIKILNT